MGESNKREMEAYIYLDPGRRQRSHAWPLERDRQPELTARCFRDQHGWNCRAENFRCVSLCSLEGGLENAKENGKKSAIIVMQDNWEII